MTFSVFFSYSNQADAASGGWYGRWASSIEEALRTELTPEASVFRDRGIGGGKKWEQTIYRELDTARVFLAMLDEHYFDSDWCKRELSLYMDRFKKDQSLLILPVKVSRVPWAPFVSGSPWLRQQPVAQRLHDEKIQLHDLGALEQARDCPELSRAAAWQIARTIRDHVTNAEPDQRAEREGRGKLVDFLVHAFGSPSEFRRLLQRDPRWSDVLLDLPAPADVERLAYVIVDGLADRDALDSTFFRTLETLRPKRKAELDAMAQGWARAWRPPVSFGLASQRLALATTRETTLANQLAEFLDPSTHPPDLGASPGGRVLKACAAGSASVLDKAGRAADLLTSRRLLTLSLLRELPGLSSAAVATVPEPRRKAIRLLCELFSTPDELQAFVDLDPQGAAVVASIPGSRHVGLEQTAREVVEAGDLCPVFGASLWRRLVTWYPERRAEIASLWPMDDLRLGTPGWRDDVAQRWAGSGESMEQLRLDLLESCRRSPVWKSLLIPDVAGVPRLVFIAHVIRLIRLYSDDLESALDTPDAGPSLRELRALNAVLDLLAGPGIRGAGESIARALALVFPDPYVLRWRLRAHPVCEEIAMDLEHSVPLFFARRLVSGAACKGLSPDKLAAAAFEGHRAFRRWAEPLAPPGVGAPPQPHRRIALLRFLLARFEVEDFVRMCAHSLPRAPIRSFPVGGPSQVSKLFEMLTIIERHGYVDAAFFQALARERPHFSAEITELAASWP